MLSGQLVPFWRGLRDNQCGGYYGFVDFDLNVDRKADKGCILNSRILWFFSSAAALLGDSALLGEAAHAYRFLANRCLDSEYGGVYWSLRHDGTPADTTKHTYNQAFAIYALSAYYGACGEKGALELMRELHGLIEGKCADPAGYCEAFERDFRPTPNEKLSENGVLADKTMNTLLHLAEAYTGYLEAAPDASVRGSLHRVIDIYERKVYNPALRRSEVFFDRAMNPLIDLHSFGHDIEASWLLDRGASELGDAALAARVGSIASALARNVYEMAYHKNSVWNELESGKADKTRVWWVLAEAVVGFVNEYQKSGDQRFLGAAADTMEYIMTYLVDKRAGSEWFWDVDDDGAPSSRKPLVEPWKCPYHNGRMCVELIRRGIDVHQNHDV
jgi:mannobiose 2-epimerase